MCIKSTIMFLFIFLEGVALDTFAHWKATKKLLFAKALTVLMVKISSKNVLSIIEDLFSNGRIVGNEDNFQKVPKTMTEKLWSRRALLVLLNHSRMVTLGPPTSKIASGLISTFKPKNAIGLGKSPTEPNFSYRWIILYFFSCLEDSVITFLELSSLWLHS